MIDAIQNRRSIRKYKAAPVSKEIIEEILKAGTMAPSSKNRQPWKFIVVSGNAKNEMLYCMKEGLEREKKEPLIPESAPFLGGAFHTFQIMKEAPVIIFILNTLSKDIPCSLSTDERIGEICNAQSIGAAIENMTLAATHLGLGSLWICDTFFAQKELCDWLDSDGELYAALAVGYADESPIARPRNAFKDVVEWRME